MSKRSQLNADDISEIELKNDTFFDVQAGLKREVYSAKEEAFRTAHFARVLQSPEQEGRRFKTIENSLNGRQDNPSTSVQVREFTGNKSTVVPQERLPVATAVNYFPSQETVKI